MNKQPQGPAMAFNADTLTNVFMTLNGTVIGVQRGLDGTIQPYTVPRVTGTLSNGAKVHADCKAERDDRTLIRFRCGICDNGVIYEAGETCPWCGAVAS
jgi:hypothetical protein